MRVNTTRISFCSGITLSLLAFSLNFLTIGVCFAEKADSKKATDIEAESSSTDGKSKVVSVTGDVIVTRGTLLIKADRAVVAGPDEHRVTSLYGNAGRKVTFRQKRDGGADLWVEGEAERVEYDESKELVKFISRAEIRYLEGKKVTQEQKGEFLSYDSVNDVFVASNSVTGNAIAGAGRVKLTIQPKSSTSSVAPDPKSETKPE